jgi:hypothetical protein
MADPRERCTKVRREKFIPEKAPDYFMDARFLDYRRDRGVE